MFSLSNRTNPLSFRLNYYNRFDSKNIYDYEILPLDYGQSFSQNTFLFNFLQNELRFFRFKVLKIRILPEFKGTINVNMTVLGNNIFIKRLRHSRIKALMHQFKTSFFFLVNRRLLNRCLRRLRKHFIKYTYKSGLRLRIKYFKRYKRSNCVLHPFFFNIKKIVTVVSQMKFVVAKFLCSLFFLPNFSRFFIKVGLLISYLIRLFQFDTKFFNSIKGKNKFKNNSFSFTNLTSLNNYFKKLKFKGFSIPLYGKIKCREQKGLTNCTVSKQILKPPLINKFFRFAFFVYKTFVSNMFAQTFVSRSVVIKHLLQHFLRNTLKKNVCINFMQINTKKRLFLSRRKFSRKKILALPNLLKKTLLPVKNIKSATTNARLLYLRPWLLTKKRQKSYYNVFRVLQRVIKSSDLEKLQRKSKNFRKRYFYLLAALYFGDVKLFNYAFCAMFKYLKEHRFFLTFITKQLIRHLGLPFFKKRVKGLFIRIRGKLNGNDRRQTFFIKIGQSIQPQRIFNSLFYNLSSVETYTGSFGIRTWLRLSSLEHVKT